MTGKIGFNSPGGAGGGGDGSGLAPESGALYLLRDGARTLTGNLTPDTQKTYGIGDASNPFASGTFDVLQIGDASTSGVRLTHGATASVLQVMRGDGAVWSRVQAIDFKTSDSDANLTGDGLQVSEDSFVAWTNGNFESSTKDIYLRRESSGILQIGDQDNAASGSIHALSGTFNQGVIIQAPNGSGWRIQVDNAGSLSAAGPFDL